MAKNLIERQGTILLTDVRRAMKCLPLESHQRYFRIVEVDQLVYLSLVIEPAVILLNEGFPQIIEMRIETNLPGRFLSEGPKKWTPQGAKK